MVHFLTVNLMLINVFEIQTNFDHFSIHHYSNSPQDNYLDVGNRSLSMSNLMK